MSSDSPTYMSYSLCKNYVLLFVKRLIYVSLQEGDSESSEKHHDGGVSWSLLIIMDPDVYEP